MKKTLYSLLTFIGIGILAGILYILVTSQGKEIIMSDSTPPIIPINIAQSGADTVSILPVEMSGGVALDPYRDNSVSGEERLYKGVPIMPVVEVSLDCSTAETETSRAQCEKFQANIERTQKEREATIQQSGSTNTGSITVEVTAPLPF